MKRWLAALILFVPALGAATAQDLLEVYEDGVKAFESGDYRTAVGLLEQAIGMRDQAGTLRRGGAMLVQYTPHAYLAIAQAQTGNCRAAFQSWDRGGGFDAVNARAEKLASRSNRARKDCWVTMIRNASNQLASVDLDALATMGEDSYVADRWASEYMARYDDLSAEAAALRAALSSMEDAVARNEFNPTELTAVAERVGTVQGRVARLRAEVEQAMTPPPAPEPELPPVTEVSTEAASSPVAAEQEQPRPPVGSAEPPANVESPPPAAPATETAQPETTAAVVPPRTTTDSLRVDEDDDTAVPAAVPAPRGSTPEPSSEPRDREPAGATDLQLRLAAAKSAFYSEGDLEAVLEHTEVVAPEGPAELRWQLLVLRAAAFYANFRTGRDDDGLQAANEAINAALDLIPGARPSRGSVPAGFRVEFETVAGRRR